MVTIAASCTVRRASDRDLYAIWTVHVRAIREVCSRVYSARQVSSWADLLTPQSYADMIRDRVVVVAEEAGEVVGFGQFNPASNEIDAVYVLPDRQQAGIGATVLRWLEQHALIAGAPRIELCATLNAVPFYERAGYLPEGLAAYHLPNGIDIECVRMSKALDPEHVIPV